MKSSNHLAAIVIFLCLLNVALAQPTPPPPPSGELLNAWPFSGTNFSSFFHCLPLSFTNVLLVPDWNNMGLQVDATNAAWLTYPIVETNGHTNLDCSQGTIELWFSPDWNSSDGLGLWGTLLEAGAWNTHLTNATGAWGLYISPDASRLCFSAQTKGAFTNYLNAPIAWYAGDWHHLLITYSPTNSALYLEGAWVTNGPGVSLVPGADVLANGFALGSDGFGTGRLQARGIYNNLITYNYQLDAATISNNYADDSQYVWPLPDSGGGFHGDDLPSFPGSGGGGTNSTGGLAASYNLPVYGSNDFWLEIIPFGTNSNSSTSNSLSLILHATVGDTAYLIQSTTNLQAYNTWTTEQTLIGSEITNFTPFLISMIGRSNLFLRAFAATLDTDGDGLPDWWELKYGLNATNADTGGTGIPDGYKQDSAGDGYNNLQKYQMGIAPNIWVTPAEVSGFNAVLNTNKTTASLTWNSSFGPVLSYTIFIQTNSVYSGGAIPSGFMILTNVSASQTSYNDSSPDFTNGVQYEIQANYAGGSSTISWSFDPTINPRLTTDARVVRGPQGAPYLVVSAMPEGVSAYRVYTGANGVDYTAYPLFGPDYIDVQYLNSSVPSFFDIPVSSITNGVYGPISTAQLPLYSGLYLTVQALGSNGQNGNIIDQGNYGIGTYRGNPNGYLGADDQTINIPFLDGRTEIAQNINFRLQAGRVANSFSLSYGLEYFSDPTPDRDHFSDPTQTNYVSAGFHYFIYVGEPPVLYDPNLDEFEPFEENSVYFQFCYNPGFLDASGNLTNGVNYLDGETYELPPFPFDTFGFVSAGITNAPAGLVTTNAARWIFYNGNVDQNVGFSTSADGNWQFQSNVRNVYGLTFTSAKWPGPDFPASFPTVYPGGEIPNPDSESQSYFSGVQPPVLQTVDYYFARPSIDPLPGQPPFSITNQTPSPLIIPFGQYFVINGWAKQAITNGYTNKFAYPEQYFDQAFLADASGNVSTNQTGILSEYGEFFATEPGKVFLTTKPDGATGTTGQVAVNVIKLQTDVDHNGIMDLSFAGQDNASEDRPMVWWLNTDHDEPGSSGGLDKDLNAPNLPDYSYGQIRSLRNLEDFARLWICGVPTLPTNYSVQIGWSQIDSGAPKMRLYWATETNGGIGYLTNTTTASQQIIDYNFPIGEITPTNSLSLPISAFTNNLNRYFLFEAGAAGKGALTLTISQGTNTIAQTSTWFDFHDIKDLYEQALVTNVIQSWPEMVQQDTNSGFQVLSYPTASTGDSNQLVVFVHGWRMTDFDWNTFSQSMFKRLYWQGYQGKFASLRWPTRSGDTDTNGYDILTFNRSEHISFESGTGAALYFYNLRQRFTNYTISVCSHSMGGIIMMEALKELAVSSQAPLDNYVLMQAAVPAQCYDTTVTNLPELISYETSIPTPNTYSNYAAGMRAALRGNIYNLFNPADFALVSGLNGTGVGSWENNEELLKPLVFFGYVYIATNSTAYVITNQYTVAFGITNLVNRIVTDPLELMPFVARPRSKAVGAQSGVGQVVNGTEFNLQSQLGFTANNYDHSGQFNRDIQTPQVQGFYSRLLSDLFPPAP